MGNPIRVTDDTNSIHDIGSVIMSYQPYQNAFLNALVNRIGMTIVTSKLWSNPWNVFKRGYLEFGETVEEIFVNIANPQSFNPATAENNIFKRQIPDIRAAFHTMNFQKFYKVTVSQDQLRQAFLSWQGITDLIAKIVDSLYTGMEKDEYCTMKYMLCKEILNSHMHMVAPATSGEKDIIKKAREISSRLTFLNTDFNQAKVQNSTLRQDQYIIISAALEASVDVEVLAAAFHMEKAEFLGHLIIVDSFSDHDEERLYELFGDDAAYYGNTQSPTTKEAFSSAQKTLLGTIYFAIVDRDWWMVFDNLTQMTQNYNGEGLYWNYWNHTWKTFSVSPYANAVAAVASLGSITSVTVTPETATAVALADYQQAFSFSAAVVTSGIIDGSVTWSAAKGTAASLASGTKIDPSTGTLTIGEGQVAGTIVVTATSNADSTKTDTATVTVSGE